MLLLAEVVKLLAEIALLCLVGQWVLAFLAGRNRDRNLFYQLFQVLTRPLLAGARWITPRVVLDRHLPLVAFLLLFFVGFSYVALKSARSWLPSFTQAPPAPAAV